MRTLGELAREHLVEEGRQTLHKMQHILQIQSRAMRELNIDTVARPKRVFLTPNSYHAIDVPDDMYDWVLVGGCFAGYVYQLTEDRGLCFPHMVNDCGELQPEPIAFPTDTNGNFGTDYGFLCGYGDWLYNITAVNEYGEFNSRSYGFSSGHNGIGTFKYDEDRRQILVSPSVQGREIALEYITTGINQELIMVPDEATECVISWTKWKTAKTLAERREYKNEYLANLIILNQRSFNVSNIQDMIAACRKGYHLAAKQ